VFAGRSSEESSISSFRTETGRVAKSQRVNRLLPGCSPEAWGCSSEARPEVHGANSLNLRGLMDRPLRLPPRSPLGVTCQRNSRCEAALITFTIRAPQSDAWSVGLGFVEALTVAVANRRIR
jgi:hypothetical protein